MVRKERIYCRRDVGVLPRHQHGLIGKPAPFEEIIAGELGRAIIE